MRLGEIILTGTSSMLCSSWKPLSFSLLVDCPQASRAGHTQAWVGRLGWGGTPLPPSPSLPFPSLTIPPPCCPNLGLGSSLWSAHAHHQTPDARELAVRHPGSSYKTEALAPQYCFVSEVNFLFLPLIPPPPNWFLLSLFIFWNQDRLN